MRVILLLVLLAFVPAQAKEKLAGPFSFDLVEVIDGDTFRVRVHIWLGQTVITKVRLKGVDAPEMNGQCAAEKKRARRAKVFAEKWLATNRAVLVNVHYGTYAGRVLATTQNKSGDSLATALLKENLAKPDTGRKAEWCA